MKIECLPLSHLNRFGYRCLVRVSIYSNAVAVDSVPAKHVARGRAPNWFSRLDLFVLVFYVIPLHSSHHAMLSDLAPQLFMIIFFSFYCYIVCRYACAYASFSLELEMRMCTIADNSAGYAGVDNSIVDSVDGRPICCTTSAHPREY